MFQTEKRNRIK